jgi:hypothetical protein
VSIWRDRLNGINSGRCRSLHRPCMLDPGADLRGCILSFGPVEPIAGDCRRLWLLFLLCLAL